MLRLFKYELRKTMLAKLILLAATIGAQAVFMIGFWTKSDITLALGALALFSAATSGIVLMGILSAIMLHRDLNTKLGYMVFMTPNNSYRILGAKVLECGLSVLTAGVFFFALGWLDFSLLLGKDANRQIWEMATEVLQAINSTLVPDFPHIASLVFRILATWLCTITTVCLADVVSTTLLNGKKANWLITLLLFFVLNWGIGKLLLLITSADVVTTLLLQGAAALALAVVMYVVSARLMEKYLSV